MRRGGGGAYERGGVWAARERERERDGNGSGSVQGQFFLSIFRVFSLFADPHFFDVQRLRFWGGRKRGREDDGGGREEGRRGRGGGLGVEKGVVRKEEGGGAISFPVTKKRSENSRMACSWISEWMG